MLSDFKRKLKLSFLKDKRFEFLFNKYVLDDEYVVLDTETTGLNPKKDEILSIGAVKIKNNKLLTSQSLELFVKPVKSISKQSIKIHHIRPIDLQNCFGIDEALEKLLYFIRNKPIVGYYISFDKNILDRYVKNLIGTTLHNQTIELSSYYYKRYRKKSAYEFVDLKFDTILKNLNIPSLGQHDALNDAIMSGIIFLKLKQISIYKGAFR